MLWSWSLHFSVLKCLCCSFYIDDIDVLRISVLPSVLDTVCSPTFNLGYSLLCSIVHHLCSIVHHLLEHSTFLYWKLPPRSSCHRVRSCGSTLYWHIALFYVRRYIPSNWGSWAVLDLAYIAIAVRYGNVHIYLPHNYDPHRRDAYGVSFPDMSALLSILVFSQFPCGNHWAALLQSVRKH
jgi:hypothetical protein